MPYFIEQIHIAILKFRITHVLWVTEAESTLCIGKSHVYCVFDLKRGLWHNVTDVTSRTLFSRHNNSHAVHKQLICRYLHVYAMCKGVVWIRRQRKCFAYPCSLLYCCFNKWFLLNTGLFMVSRNFQTITKAKTSLKIF